MFENICDETLLVETKTAVLKEKTQTSRVLDYLGEVDRRRLWLKEGYASLYDFCIRYLGYSEGETHRRIQACRLSQKVVEVKPLLENGTLSLTSLTLLSPVLEKSNAQDLLPKVINKPSREVADILAKEFPEKIQKEILKIVLDEELKELLEQAKRLASEKDGAVLLKRVLKSFVRQKKTRNTVTPRHTHRVLAHTAKEVKDRDGYQCSYVGPNGVRCNQTAHLQIDHIRPYALGGSSRDLENLRLLCRAHNLAKACLDFPRWERPQITPRVDWGRGKSHGQDGRALETSR
ncbi:MAG: HNH endonuclease [Deltaproteobacteria bacterium]|nr:HNH endonuclease [Deltaproteobacteria bacterium]MBI3295768.1 HNH endonuclease [Deltaproteobacteria bacterium]